MKFFIASPWQNKDVVKSLTIALAAQGHEAYSFLDNGANLVGGAPAVEESEEEDISLAAGWENDPKVKEVFESNIKALKESDEVILLEPSGRSSLVEAGIAYGMGKKVVRVGLVAHPEVFAYCICGNHYPSVEEFLSSLNNTGAQGQ
jgi:hypothetical protein